MLVHKLETASAARHLTSRVSQRAGNLWHPQNLVRLPVMYAAGLMHLRKLQSLVILQWDRLHPQLLTFSAHLHRKSATPCAP